MRKIEEVNVYIVIIILFFLLGFYDGFMWIIIGLFVGVWPFLVHFHNFLPVYFACASQVSVNACNY